MKKKTFDAVAFMRKRREELSRAYAGLTAEQIERRIQRTLKADPLWRKPPEGEAIEKTTWHRPVRPRTDVVKAETSGMAARV